MKLTIDNQRGEHTDVTDEWIVNVDTTHAVKRTKTDTMGAVTTRLFVDKNKLVHTVHYKTDDEVRREIEFDSNQTAELAWIKILNEEESFYSISEEVESREKAYDERTIAR